MSKAEPTRELAPVQPSHADEVPENDPTEIQRLLAWYFHGEDPPRTSGGEREGKTPVRIDLKAAVQSLGDSLIAWANKYQTAKIDALTSQIAVDKATISTLQQTLTAAQNQLKALGGSGMSSTDKATVTAALLSTISDTGSRIDEISLQLTQNQMFQASAKDVEAAGYVQTPSGGRVTASNRKSRLIVAIFVGLVVGVILALLWDSVRRRPRKTQPAAAP